jgi:hypothetical protein
MIIKGFKNYFFTFVCPRFYGGGGAPSQNTTVQQRNIPDELKPYYEIMLNSMMKQGFTNAANPGKKAPSVAADWTPHTSSYAKGGEVKHYVSGGMTATDLSQNLQQLTGASVNAGGTLNPGGITQYQPLESFTDSSGNYDPNKLVAPTSGLQNQSYKAAAQIGLPQQNIAASNLAAAAGVGGANTAASALDYGGMGYQAGLNSAELGNAAAGTAATNATNFANNALDYGALGAEMGAAGANAGKAYENKATNAGTVNAYMNPYLDASLKPQLALMDQQNAIANQKSNSQAAQAGAYGGSRQTVANNLNDQSNKLAQAGLIGQGYKSAYDTAQNNILQGSQLGLQGYNTGIQGAQTGLSGVGAATSAGQYGLQGTQAGLAGQQQAIAGAGMGLQGVSGAQAGYGLEGTAGQQLMAIGNQQLAQQQSIANMQNTYGAQQQALDQQAINNAISYNDYQQKYPWEILGNIGNVLNGVQTGSMSTFAPAPNPLSQVAGLGLAGVSAYNAVNRKKGGVIKSPKAKSGGIGDLAVYNAMKGGK